jgi:hypothetical protein
MDFRGSMTPRSVVPAVATTAIGIASFASIDSRLALSASASMRPVASVGTVTTASASSPRRKAARETEK